MSFQSPQVQDALPSQKLAGSWQQQSTPLTFLYFAYGSCMCPVDLKRTLGENTHTFVVGPATLKGYRLSFNRRSVLRNCGVLDIVKEAGASMEGVLYRLPYRLSDALDEREEVPQGGYRQEIVNLSCGDQMHTGVRTYVVVNKLSQELAPNDWYFNVVLRGAVTCGLSEEYCWKLFEHMHQLQRHHGQTRFLRSA